MQDSIRQLNNIQLLSSFNLTFNCSIICLYLSTPKIPKVGIVSGKLTQIGSHLLCHYPKNSASNPVCNIGYFEKVRKISNIFFVQEF